VAPVYPFATQLGIDTAATVTKRFDFQAADVVLAEDFVDTNGLRGTRARAVERLRQGNRRVGGPLRLQPTAVEMANLLAWIMGGSPTGSPTVTYPLADTLADRYVVIDRGSKVFSYNGCRVNRATFRGAQGQPLDLTLDVVGIDETLGNSGTFPALTLDVTTVPFMFTDLVFVLNAVTVQALEVEITIDNAIDTNRFFNSQIATALIATDRHVTLNTRLSYGDQSALYGTGVGGVAATATFTAGGQVLTFTFAKVAFPRHSPPTRGREEVMLPLQGTCYKSGSTLELITSLNPGP
jgi:hypothetical protein